MVDSKTLGVLTNLGVGCGIFLAVLIIYDILRYYLPGMYFYRESAAKDPVHVNYDGTPFFALPRPSSRPLSWVWSTLSYPELTLIRTHGLDVAMYLRFLRTQIFVFFVLSIFTSIVLIPTYATGRNSGKVEGIEIASLSNVPPKSWRLWITLVSEIVLVGTVSFFLYKDLSAYTHYRRKYRSNPYNPSNYAIIVLDIPEESRKKDIIYKMFDRLFPGEIVDVHQVRDAEKLENIKTKYLTTVMKRERAEWDYHQALDEAETGGSDPDVASARRRRISAAASEPSSSQGNLRDQHEPFAEPNNNVKITTGEGHLYEENEPIVRWRGEEDQLRHEIAELEHNIDEIAPLTSAAIIVFKSKRAATFASVTPVWRKTGSWLISRAAEPKGVNWNRLDINGRTTLIRTYTSFAILTAIAIFWTVPASFIQALNNLSSLARSTKNESFISFIENNEGFVDFLEGVLPPILLFVVLLLIPLLMRFILSFERIHNRVLLESKIRNFLYFFYIMSNFIYVVLIGSVLDQLDVLIQLVTEKPVEIVNLLSRTVPKQATFLMKYVLINAFLGSTLGMLNIGRLLFRPFVMASAKTPREIQRKDGLFAQYPFSKLYAICNMIALIAYVYSTISPIINIVALLYFCIAYLCTKQTLMYSHRPLFEGGGYLFRDTWTGLLIGLFLHQVSMIGIFSLKLATAQAIIVACSFVFSIWFTLRCRKHFFLRAKHGSAVDQANMDEELERDDVIPPYFSELYIHPGLKDIQRFHEKHDILKGPLL